MDVQNGGQAPQMKWGWRYLGWAVVPLLAGVLLARYAGPVAPEAVARATAATEGSWAQHLASPLGLFLLQLLVLLLVAKGAGALLKRLGQPAVIGEMAAGLMMGRWCSAAFCRTCRGRCFRPVRWARWACSASWAC